MRAADIVTQLKVLLPQLTDKFTDDVEVLSIVRQASTVDMLVSCKDKHELEVGNAFAIVNTDTPLAINSLTRSGTTGTLVTTKKHDLTRSTDSIGRTFGPTTVRITGANEAKYNGIFDIIDILNRNTITFVMSNIVILTFDNQRLLFTLPDPTQGFTGNESVIVATDAGSSGSLKFSASGSSRRMDIQIIRDSVDLSVTGILSIWMRVDANVYATLGVSNIIQIRIGSSLTQGVDYATYGFPKSAIPAADTWFELTIDVLNDTPIATGGSVDFASIITYQLSLDSQGDNFPGLSTAYFDELQQENYAGPATGSPVLRDSESYLESYNSTFEVSDVINDAQVKFGQADAALGDPDGNNMLLRTKPRISAGINLDRLIAAYTSYDIDQYWAFVVLGDVNASQSRRIGSDAIDDQQRNVEFRQQIIEPFTVYVFIPVKDEIAAANARDEASNLLRPMLRSLLFSKFDTGLYSGQLNSVQFAGHSVASYNTSLYIHAYDFQQVAEIYQEDTVGPDNDVAFRDINFSVKLDFGTQVNFMGGTPKLDD